MNRLKFTNTKYLKFQHNKNGVVAIYNNKKYIIGYLSISNESENFSDSVLSQYAQIVLDFQCNVRGLPSHKIESQNIFTNGLIENDYRPIHKYMKSEIFNNYIKKGSWQLGCIEQYRTIENQKQRDEFEGYAFINMIMNNHLVSTVCNSGFNYLIFCGTHEDNSTFHENQFGEKKISIPNVKAFAESIKMSINAKRYYVQKVSYNSVKLFINRDAIYNNKISLDNILNEQFFECLKDNFLYPSLFVKPETFKPENEVRIIFEMHKDYKKPLRFDNIGLNYLINS